jgi:membrane associated rhomboid family serine protease
VIALVHWLDAYWRGALHVVGVVDKLAVLQGEWWRLATAVSLHSDTAHLATNATLGLIVIGFVLGRFGPGLGLLLAYLAGIAGNIPGLLLYPRQYQGLGASGMVMGAVGLLAVQSLGPFWRHPSGTKFLVGGLFGASMILLLMGTNPGTDVVAHFAGFLAGIALGFPSALLPRKRIEKPALQTACAWLLAALFAVTWILAWKFSRPSA